MVTRSPHRSEEPAQIALVEGGPSETICSCWCGGGRQTPKTWCHLLGGGPQTPTTVAHQVPGAASRLVRTPEETSRSQNFRARYSLSWI